MRVDETGGMGTGGMRVEGTGRMRADEIGGMRTGMK